MDVTVKSRAGLRHDLGVLRDELMAGRGSIHRAEYMNVGPAGTLPRAAFNWRDPTVLAAVGQLGGSFDDVGESAQAWPAPARFGEEAPTE